jgi:hypothetical protein
MPFAVDFNTVSTVGLESAPLAAALAGLRAHEATAFQLENIRIATSSTRAVCRST